VRRSNSASETALILGPARSRRIRHRAAEIAVSTGSGATVSHIRINGPGTLEAGVVHAENHYRINDRRPLDPGQPELQHKLEVRTEVELKRRESCSFRFVDSHNFVDSAFGRPGRSAGPHSYCV